MKFTAEDFLIFFFIAVATFILVIAVFYKRKKQLPQKRDDEEVKQLEPISDASITEEPRPVFIAEQLPPPAHAVENTVATPVPENLTEKEKGDLFERYVVSRFNKEYFRLVEWRGDKYHEGVYASSNVLPDLEYHFRTSWYDLRIAVECKWRATFIKGRLEWAKGHQLVTYRDYERERGIPVFVIIGMGGGPDSPEHIYIIPLRDIRSNVLSEGQLKKYYRHRAGNFYLHAEPMVLE